MRTTSRNNTRLAPVEAEEVRIRPIDAAERREMLLEERILRSQIARERASAYWFAATKWGISGLVIGILIGGYMMYVASVATIPIAQDAMSRGAAIQDARDQIRDGAGLTDEALPSNPNPVPRR
jgi:predicted RNase H-like HicB family nuclease